MGAFSSKKLRQCFYGVEVADEWPDERKVIRCHRFDRPPSYLVKPALMELYGDRLPQGGDKSEWALPLTFEEGI